MKILILIVFIEIGLHPIVFAQAQRGSKNYKSENFKKTENSTSVLNKSKNNNNSINSQSECDCLLPLDNTFSIVSFEGIDSDGISTALAPEFRNDDLSSAAIALPFTFKFYGVPYNEIIINNNGNISFDAAYFNYDPEAFPSSTYKMIAPLWSDVDTRDLASGLVYYKITSSALIVIWQNVGYFDTHSDLNNTFQLIITNGFDPLLPQGNNVSFCYGDMQWTTGDASSGVNGFYGFPAVAGINVGNNVNFFQIGAFNSPGNLYSGPYSGDLTGIDFLDNKEFHFNVMNNGNIPPIVFDNLLCDTLQLLFDTATTNQELDSLTFRFAVYGPEQGQSFINNIIGNFDYSITKINSYDAYEEFLISINVQNLNDGVHEVSIVSTDNGTSPKSSTSNIYFNKLSGVYTSLGSHNLTQEVAIKRLSPRLFEIKLNNIATGNYTIKNINGGTILNGKFTTGLIKLDLTSQSDGVYGVYIECNNQKKLIKLINY